MGGEDHKCIKEVWRKYWPKTQDGDYGGDDAKGHQEDLMKHSCMQTSLKYEGCKEFLIKFSNQEAALSKATPKAVINQMSGEEVEVDILGKEKGKGGGCWNCGGTRHIAAQCPTPKGKGKGTRKGEG